MNNKSNPLETVWKRNLFLAANLIGKSQTTQDLEQAFLWEMIALEILVGEDSGQKYQRSLEILPFRISPFFDWDPRWEKENYEKRIKEILKKRNNFVHMGKSKINGNDLVFLDHVLFNLLTNILKNMSIFKNKKDVLQFSKKIKAKSLLKVSKNVGPKNLQIFSSPKSSKKISQELEKTFLRSFD